MQTVRNGERSGTVNGQERLETFEPGRNNALERIVENVHGTVTHFCNATLNENLSPFVIVLLLEIFY